MKEPWILLHVCSTLIIFINNISLIKFILNTEMNMKYCNKQNTFIVSLYTFDVWPFLSNGIIFVTSSTNKNKQLKNAYCGLSHPMQLVNK